MNRWFALTLFFPVLLLSVLSVISVTYQERAYEEFIQLKLNKVMNNANDAAMIMAKASGTINNTENVELNPDDMWATYKAVFLSSFGIYDKYYNEVLEAYTPGVLLAVNNGFYMKMRYDSKSKTGYRFSQKIPYSMLYNYNGTDYVVSLTMNRKNEYALNPTATASLEYYENGYSAISNQKVFEVINEQLINGMRSMISSASLVSKQQFFIPVQLVDDAQDAAVNFKGMSLMVMVQGFDLFTRTPINNFTISNTQMTESEAIYCYRTNEGRFYTNIQVFDGAWVLEKTTKDIYTAAKYGYKPHPRLYQ